MVDEAWAILSNLGVARWLQSSWKLSRAFGVSNVAVLHRVSDLRSVGAPRIPSRWRWPRDSSPTPRPCDLCPITGRAGPGR